MDTVKKGRDLSEDEKQEMYRGHQLYEMTQSQGWKVLLEWLTDRAYHTWVDPREIEGDNPKEVWMWRELNAFHSADVSKQLLKDIQDAVNRAEYLGKIESGEITEGVRMRI